LFVTIVYMRRKIDSIAEMEFRKNLSVRAHCRDRLIDWYVSRITIGINDNPPPS
jgi:hypothetical protein